MKDLIIMGKGGHALSCLDVIKSTNQYNVIGYVDVAGNMGDTWFGLPFLGTDSELPELVKKCSNFFLAIGQIKNSDLRKKTVSLLKKLDANFPVIVSPKSHIGFESQIGEGSIVMHGAHVGPGAIIGEFGILNTHCLIEHGVKVGSFVHVSTGTVVNGDVEIGNEVFLGSNSVVCHGMKIPDLAFVQAGEFIGRKHVWR
jgi:sugar O-acyltransferase (sialic acid O-acetyltransferase NeuD family)